MTETTPAAADDENTELHIDYTGRIFAPPSLIFDVPGVRWPSDGSVTLLRDIGLREGQIVSLRFLDGSPKTYRVTQVVPPDDDSPTETWTVSLVEWQ